MLLMAAVYIRKSKDSEICHIRHKNVAIQSYRLEEYNKTIDRHYSFLNTN